MEAPIGKRSLAEIQKDILTWIGEHAVLGGEVTSRPNPALGPGGHDDIFGVLCCVNCQSPIQQTTLYASVHDSIWSGCVGGGEVINLRLPYCPRCEPLVAAQIQRTCIHGDSETEYVLPGWEREETA